MKSNQRELNSTADGQKAMCAAAASRAVLFILAAKLRKLGVPTYDDNLIASFPDTSIEAIKTELLTDYNTALGGSLSH